MSRGQFRVLLIVCAAASLLGGALSGSLMGVRAQDHPWAKRTTAESFVVVDERGAKRAELSVTSQGDAALVLYDERGTGGLEHAKRAGYADLAGRSRQVPVDRAWRFPGPVCAGAGDILSRLNFTASSNRTVTSGQSHPRGVVTPEARTISGITLITYLPSSTAVISCSSLRWTEGAVIWTIRFAKISSAQATPMQACSCFFRWFARYWRMPRLYLPRSYGW